MGAGERSDLTEARRVKSWTMLFVPRRSEFRAMVSGFDYVLFLVLCERRKFMSRKPRVHFPEAVYQSSPRGAGGEQNNQSPTPCPFQSDLCDCKT
jgi:hypothetical protein